MTLGRERRLRERVLGPAQLSAGEAVLDVACGTGTLAIMAQQQAGASGKVAGIDASPEMIARARYKADRAGLSIQFAAASADALPFADAQFDVVLCTVALHHLRRGTRSAAVAEMGRVLKPGGRVLLVDFVFGPRHTLIGMLHHQHGLRAHELSELAQSAGLHPTERGAIGMWDMHYVVAR